MKSLAVCLIAMCCAAGAFAAEQQISTQPQPQKMREWKSADGRPMTGMLRKASETSVDIVRKDGRLANIALDQLSDDDKAYVRAHLDELKQIAEDLRRAGGLKAGTYAKAITGEWTQHKTADGLPYQLFGGGKLKPTHLYPLVIYLHGAGGRGDDNTKQMESGALTFAKTDVYKEHPCFILAPQVPTDSGWGAQCDKTLALIKDIANNLPVDKKRIYLHGYSMGGFGIYDFLKADPNLFSAAVPVAGGSKPELAATSLKAFPIWIWHGDKDDMVKAELSIKMADALKAVGNTVYKFTLLPGEGHGINRRVVEDAEVQNWLFAQTRK